MGEDKDMRQHVFQRTSKIHERMRDHQGKNGDSAREVNHRSMNILMYLQVYPGEIQFK